MCLGHKQYDYESGEVKSAFHLAPSNFEFIVLAAAQLPECTPYICIPNVLCKINHSLLQELKSDIIMFLLL